MCAEFHNIYHRVKCMIQLFGKYQLTQRPHISKRRVINVMFINKTLNQIIRIHNIIDEDDKPI